MLGLLFFFGARAHASPAFVPERPAHYSIEPANGVLGPMVFLHPRTSPDGLGRWVEGMFLPYGEIRSVVERGQRRPLWRSKRAGDSDQGSIEFKALDDGKIEIWVTSRRHPIPFRHVATPMASEPRATRTRFLSHRGRCLTFPSTHHGTYPCNTIPAFDEALESGYGGFEFDLRLSKDGRLIVSHDEKLDVASRCQGKVSEYTLEQLMKCEVLASTVLPEATSRRAPRSAWMPSLDEVLDRYLTDARLPTLMLDVKPDQDTRLEVAIRKSLDRALQRIGDRAFLSRVIVVMRSDELMRRLSEDYPEATWSLEGSTGLEPLLDDASYIPEHAGLPRGGHDSVSLSLTLALAMPGKNDRIADLIARSHAHGYQVVGWNVNGEGGISRVQTEYPSLDVMLSDEPYSEIARLQMAGSLGWSHVLSDAMRRSPGRALGPRIGVGALSERTRTRQSVIIEFVYSGVAANDVPLSLRFVEVSGEFESTATGVPYANVQITPLTGGLHFGEDAIKVHVLPFEFHRDVEEGLRSAFAVRVAGVSGALNNGFARFALSFLGLEVAHVGHVGENALRKTGLELLAAELVLGQGFESGPLEFRFDFAGVAMEVGQITRRIDFWQELAVGLRGRLLQGKVFVRYGYRLLDVTGVSPRNRGEGYLRAGMRLFF